MELRSKIKNFILDFIGTCEFENDDDIFELGFVTSMFAMELVTFVEGEFGITVENEDLDLANFSTVNAIARLVESKMGDAGDWSRAAASAGGVS